MKIDYNNFEIEVFDDQNYTLNSPENSFHYQKVYFEGKYQEKNFYSTSKHAIVIKKNEAEISSAIICATGGATGIYENSFIIEDKKIWIRVCNTLYCLQIPSLEIVWHKEFDFATNFGIYKLEKDFIIYGEVEIFRITKEGEIVWRFGGRDIWVNLEGKNPFNIESDKIRLIDFESNEYVLDFNGKQIEDNQRVVLPKVKRKWWQIFG
ncbi:hypothetical protein ASE40_13850 [Flavobacterium sp. Root935]|uniref:hypothetical protein n=1 Tax=unclassified Flavobacterium TaxID=196869 RepID=UPI00070C8F55|nr:MULTISPECIES: hypothetical protein [unclassified Flavobacterium]KRD59257.1 hypothetical protein ASE40_13850 [Flavobacterium sp. Root935]TDX09474.1 hypothetical protein EDB96_3774 [Flavobacterium sp. S87F.05.LMB.W.Kidney.N]